MTSHKVVLGCVALATLLGGCDGITSVDNYDEPSSTITGRVVYQGEPIGVRSGGVDLELWQPDFDLDVKIPVNVAQDGSFSAVAFDGSYEINLLAGNGPWLDNTQRMAFELNGEMDLEIPVVPYYTVENENISNSNDVIQATFNVGQVETSRPVEFVGLYVSTTTLVDRNNQVVRVERSGEDIDDLDAPISLSVELPDDIRVAPGPDPRENVFVRIGIKTAGVVEMLFSQVEVVGL